MEEHDREIESEQIKAAHAAKAVSLRAMDSFMTKRSEAARRQHVKGKPRRKKIRKTLARYTRQQLRNALESLVTGHKTDHPTKSAAREATSVRRAARLFLDNRYTTLGRILREHDVVVKIQSMTL